MIHWDQPIKLKAQSAGCDSELERAAATKTDDWLIVIGLSLKALSAIGTLISSFTIVIGARAGESPCHPQRRQTTRRFGLTRNDNPSQAFLTDIRAHSNYYTRCLGDYI